MEAIVAVYEDWGIGAKGTQPVVIPEDRKRFKELTEGNAIIVGRKTLADFPDGKPLPGRKNYVLTTQNIEIPGAVVCHSVEEVMEATKNEPRVFVVGGQSVYDQLITHCDRIYITRIYTHVKSDSYFQNLDENFNWEIMDYGDAQFHDGIKYRFCEYELYDMLKGIDLPKK